MQGANDELIRGLLRQLNDLKRQVLDLAALESAGGGGGASDFLDLTDTPSAYTGAAGKLLAVNSTPNAVEFIAAPVATSSGGADAGKVVKLDASGLIDASMIDDSDIDHANIANHGTNSHATIDSHIAATAAHGVSGDLVGTSDSQTLTNKTLTTPTIASLVNATHVHQSAAGGGTLDHGLALTGLTDDDHTIYALLAGRSGGQSVKGGTGSGDDLTLESTSHATKGTVFVQPSGGNVGILNVAPDGTVHIGDTGGGDSTVELLIQSTGGRTFICGAFDSGLFTHFGTQSNHNFRIVTNNAEVLRIETDGKISHGGFSAQLFEHSHDGTSGRAFGTVTVSSGTAQTIIPNGSGDVTDVLFYEVIVNPSTGSSVYVSGSTTPTGTTITLFDSGGTETCVLHCNADGSVDIQRTAGTRTYVCSVRLFWQ